ncbi:hypothetical protein FHX42_000805 [Saccharopolyspora lacisalsi]|uniref:Toxin-antitoxin system HicB family antitoxin n=1 Tax=Halosaccharopolyspora lacisalsi TaxID=1000566 RepID=A0A839DT73_9PSEU|nr:hypothetical protein [Halosaccharopolyspora lacisalsi]MBA8823476.1 hypothetical protein [Halosaccharopolyspora lacisalsi]
MRTTISLDQELYEHARQWAEADGVSANEWMIRALDREDTRRRHLAHNEWSRTNRDLLDQWDAELHGSPDHGSETDSE